MATAEILKKLSLAQQKTLTGSEYIVSMWSRATALNYPVVQLRNSKINIPLFIEKISYSSNAASIEIYTATNVAALTAPDNSSIRYFNKRLITGNVSTEFLGFMGEITPGQYSALIFGEDLYTKQSVVGGFVEGEIDFSQSNILLQADPATNATQSILLVGVQAAKSIYASIELCQIDFNTNKLA